MESWYYENNLNSEDIQYAPQENHFLDIWQREHDAEPIIREGSLGSKNLDEYLSETPDFVNHSPIMSGFRVIYSWVDEDTDYDDETVFWSKTEFLKIMESFQLPKRFTQMLSRSHCLFAEFPPQKAAVEKDRYGYIFSSMFQHSPFWYIAASWDPKTSTTYALMHCAADVKRDYISAIKQVLTKTTFREMHPLLLPVLIMDLETNGTLLDDVYWTGRIKDIEINTGQRPRDTSTVGPLDLDLASIVQQLNGASVFLSVIERESETVLLHLSQVKKVISDLQSKYPSLEEASCYLMPQVDFLINSRKNLFLRLQNLQRRCQTQLAFTYNFLAQRDNMLNIELTRDSKVLALASSRDSTAMKTVSILSIVFLPGTFLASLFAMPVFDLQASSKINIVGPYFWVYWAFAIPLTVLVLGIWGVWIRIVTNRHQKEDNNARNMEFQGLVPREGVGNSFET